MIGFQIHKIDIQINLFHFLRRCTSECKSPTPFKWTTILIFNPKSQKRIFFLNLNQPNNQPKKNSWQKPLDLNYFYRRLISTKEKKKRSWNCLKKMVRVKCVFTFYIHFRTAKTALKIARSLLVYCDDFGFLQQFCFCCFFWCFLLLSLFYFHEFFWSPAHQQQ